MAFSFSNPTPDPQNDPAKLQSGFKVDAPNIGYLVSAILEARNRQAQLQRQQMQDLSSGIGAAAKGIGQYQQAGQANDAANAAMYGWMNPNDPTGAYTDPGRVPDYGGTDAMNQYKLQQAMIANSLQNSQSLAKTEAYQSLADQRSGSGGMGTPNIYTDPNTGQQYYQNSKSGYSPVRGGSSGNQSSGPDTTFDAMGREWRRGANGNWVLIPQSQAGQIPQYPDQTVYPDDPVASGSQMYQQTQQQGQQPSAVPQQAPQAQTGVPGGNPPAATGIAPSREEAPVGGAYRAPDGSVRTRTS